MIYNDWEGQSYIQGLYIETPNVNSPDNTFIIWDSCSHSTDFCISQEIDPNS